MLLSSKILFKSLLLFTTINVCAHFNLHAKQTYFSKQNNLVNKLSVTQFDYTWQQNNQELSLSFALSNADLMAMPSSPVAYSQNIFQQSVYVRVMQEAQKIDSTLGKINIIKTASGMSFRVSSTSNQQAEQILAQLERAHNQAELDYWDEHFFIQYTDQRGAVGIRHDHAKYTNLSSSFLNPIVNAIKSLQKRPNDSREFIQIALGWIQNIPYNPLINRISSNGAGFVSPKDLLLFNQGDCDSKSTLMAALLKAYDPHIKVQMIYLPNHALLGVSIQPKTQERTIRLAGVDYVLIEPTGPAQLAIGELPKSSTLALRNRQIDMTTL